MKPPPRGIVWSGRRRTCPRCGAVVTRAWAVDAPYTTAREWSCFDCLTPEDRANGQPIAAVAEVVRQSEAVDGWAENDVR